MRRLALGMLIAAALLLQAHWVAADPRIRLIKGNIMPLGSEVLAKPIMLSCGLRIYEWRGADPDVDYVQRLCQRARLYIERFLLARGLTPRPPAEPFAWSASMIPEGDCYRCLNDTTFRFDYRADRPPILGLAVLYYRHIFMLSDTHSENFGVTFVHELFHAFSHYFGTSSSYPGTPEERVAADEANARAFTRYLGFGE